MNYDIEAINNSLKELCFEDIIQKAKDIYGDKIVFLSSMGLEDMVILDVIAKNNLEIPIYTIDTGRLYNETYSLINKTEIKYNVKINIAFPDNSEVEEMVNKKGINLFYNNIEDRKLCCHIRKIKPLRRILQNQNAWICGLRKEQSVTRLNINVAEEDKLNNIVKINPLLEWTEEMVWEYIKRENVPYNVLHDKGFPSIGCQPCTRAIKENEDVRAGRWWWENPEQKECGLHK